MAKDLAKQRNVTLRDLFSRSLFPQSIFDDWFDVGEVSEGWKIPVDIHENEERIVIKAALPGMKSDEIKLTVHDGILRIQAEKFDSTEDEKDGGYTRREVRYGKFERAIQLPRNLDFQKITSNYKDGFLTVTLSRSEEAKPLNITVD